MADKTVHIALSEEEYAKVKGRAESVGMSVTAFIRTEALEGKTKGFNVQVLNQHTKALGDLAYEVRWMILLPSKDRWKYEADIDHIDQMVSEMLQAEKSLHETMIRRTKR